MQRIRRRLLPYGALPDLLKTAESVGTLELALLMDETTGSTLNDSSGNGINFSLNGSPVLGGAGLTSNSGTSVDFDGSLDNAVANTSALGRLGWSYMMLVHFDSIALQAIFDWNASGSTQMRINSGQLAFDFNASGIAVADSASALSVGTPYFTCFSLESNGDPHIYTAPAGGSVAEVGYVSYISDSSPDQSTTTFWIAAQGGTLRFLNGQMGFIFAWSSVLTASEFQKIANASGA